MINIPFPRDCTITAIVPAGSKEGTVTTSSHPRILVGQTVRLSMHPSVEGLQDLQPVVSHRMTNYKVKNFHSQTLESGDLQFSCGFLDPMLLV